MSSFIFDNKFDFYYFKTILYACKGLFTNLNYMKKYFAVALLSTLILASCGTKVDENKTKTNTWTTTTTGTTTEKTTTNTGNTVDLSKGTTGTGTASDTKTSTGTTVDLNKTTPATSYLTEKDGQVSYKNTEKGYELSFKKTDNLQVKEGTGWFAQPEIAVADTKTGSSVSILSENYWVDPKIDSLEKYFNLSVEGIQNQFKPKDLKKEPVEINGLKWFKVSYELTNDKTNLSMKLEQYIFENDKKLAYIITKGIVQDSANAQLDTIIKSFKLIK